MIFHYLGIEKRYLPLNMFPTDVTEIVGKILSTDGAGLMATEEGCVLPPLQTDVAQPSLVLLLHLPHLHGRLGIHVRDPVLNLHGALQALLHSPAAIKAGNLNTAAVLVGALAVRTHYVLLYYLVFAG